MIARKTNPQSIHYILPCLAATLKETYGILVYQEQVMQIAKDIAHFTPAQADELRTAICRASTTREAQLKALKPIFINQATENGHDRNDVLQLWQWLCDQGFSAFNKSHTLCYTLIAYQMAYLKNPPSHTISPRLFSSQRRIETLVLEGGEQGGGGVVVLSEGAGFFDGFAQAGGGVGEKIGP